MLRWDSRPSGSCSRARTRRRRLLSAVTSSAWHSRPSPATHPAICVKAACSSSTQIRKSLGSSSRSTRPANASRQRSRTTGALEYAKAAAGAFGVGERQDGRVRHVAGEERREGRGRDQDQGEEGQEVTSPGRRANDARRFASRYASSSRCATDAAATGSRNGRRRRFGYFNRWSLRPPRGGTSESGSNTPRRRSVGWSGSLHR